MIKRREYGVLVALALISGLTGGFASNFFLVGQPVMAQKPRQFEKVVRAERFELVDQEGTIRARLEFGPEIEEETLRSMLEPVLPKRDQKALKQTNPRLVFTDRDGQPLAKVGLRGLYLYEKPGQTLPRAQLSLEADGTPQFQVQGENFRAEFSKSISGIGGLIISDQHGTPRTVFGLSPEGRPGLALMGEGGIVRVGMGLFPKEKPGLFLYDNEGRGRTVYGLTDQGEPVLSLYDKDFKQRALLTLGPQSQEPALSFYGEDMHPLAVLGSTEYERTYEKSVEARPASSLLLFGKNAKVVWSAP